MRKEKALVALLTDLVHIVSEEYAQNPTFAARIDAALQELPEQKKRRSSSRNRPAPVPQEIPDVYLEFERLSEPEFMLWVRELPVPVLREIIRSHDLDATRRTSKWNDPEKLGKFITDQLSGRTSRGRAFLRG